ncbi:vWA domain-containing protein [Leptolyngbya sp. AN03gr2]|uniref:vWA domain-containing protein n=1 Tax=unclassified Leptolyngbya TaxID=2650499 RepID=UPI003D31A71E
MNPNPFRIPLILLSLTGLVACSSASQTSSKTESSPTTSEQVTPVKSEENTNAAEAYYQQLLSQYGQDCLECLKPLEFDLKQAKRPGNASGSNAEDNRQVNVLVALDSSGSMAETAGGQVKMDSAKSAIDKFVNQLPKASNVSLLLYGHKGSSQAADKAVSCAGIETVYPLSPLNAQRFQSVVNAVQPTGYTPIAAALQKASTVFANANGDSNRNIVYVVSDGLETCGGDPVTVARQLQSSNAKVIVNVIGFDVDNESQRQLKAVAEAGGGKFISVRTAKELDNSLDEFNRMMDLTNYRFTAGMNQTNVRFDAGRVITNFRFCVGRKLTDERFDIMRAVTNARSNQEPNAVHANYVEEQLKKRHQNLESWRDRVVQGFESQRDVTLEQIQQDLNQVLQQSPNP